MRESCDRYPCHFEGQDCTFCFCPFYPCLDESLGCMIDGVWRCDGCTMLHRADVAAEVVEALLRGDELEAVWRRVRSQT
ncbi:MAG: cysteine-rich small domain-containing protein [Methanothrix sp.]